MNINIQRSNRLLIGNQSMFFGSGRKSTQEKLERQEKRDTQVAFFENQKENLKTMKCDTLDDISRKLEMLHSYEDEIAAAKAAYNNEQMSHVMDEARELGEKIAENAKRMEPKTPEERKEERIEEALGTDEEKGILTEAMEELTDIVEELQDLSQLPPEELEDSLEQTAEKKEDIEEALPEGMKNILEQSAEETKDILEQPAEETKDILEQSAEETKDILEQSAEETKDILEQSAEETKDIVEYSAEETKDILKQSAEETKDVKELSSEEKSEMVKSPAEKITGPLNLGEEVTIDALAQERLEAVKEQAIRFYERFDIRI